MKKKEFFDKAMAQRYLKHSVVRVDGGAVYILDVSRSANRRGFDIVYQDIASGRHGKVDVNSLRVDLNPIPVGMMQYNGNTVYLVRMPVRRWKIGLSANNCQAWNTYPGNIEKKLYVGANITHLITSSSFAKAAQKDYDDVRVARGNSTRYTSVPFSQRFAVRSTGAIVYKNFNDTVGEVMEGDEGWVGVLKPRYEFLTQALNEDLK